MDRIRVDVAVGVVFNEKGQVLVAKRQSHQHQANAWEFPGGKIEPGETVPTALKRELFEEVGIEVVHHEPWLEIEHDYPDKSVRLCVFKVISFKGQASGREGQLIAWHHPETLPELLLPKANELIVQALIASK